MGKFVRHISVHFISYAYKKKFLYIRFLRNTAFNRRFGTNQQLLVAQWGFSCSPRKRTAANSSTPCNDRWNSSANKSCCGTRSAFVERRGQSILYLSWGLFWPNDSVRRTWLPHRMVSYCLRWFEWRQHAWNTRRMVLPELSPRIRKRNTSKLITWIFYYYFYKSLFLKSYFFFINLPLFQKHKEKWNKKKVTTTCIYTSKQKNFK